MSHCGGHVRFLVAQDPEVGVVVDLSVDLYSASNEQFEREF